MAKVAQQVLISPHAKERILACAVVRQEAQAEVNRWLIEAALPALEQTHASLLRELRATLDRLGVNHAAALADMAETRLRPDGTRRRLTLADIRNADTYVFGQEGQDAETSPSPQVPRPARQPLRRGRA